MHPPNWPSPSQLTYFLLETPWAVVACLLFLGGALFLHGRRSQARKIMIGGFAACAAGLGVLLLATVVVTDREKMMERNRALVAAAVVPLDVEVFRETLASDVLLFDRSREQILDSLQRATSRWRITGAYITDMDVFQENAGSGQTYFTVITKLDTSLGSGPSKTRWLLHWRKESDGAWRITQIQWLDLNDSKPSSGDLP